MSGRGLRGNNASCSALGCLPVSSPTTHKQIGPFWCWFPGGWVCVHSRTLWVSPMNSPVRLVVYPTTSTPTGFFSRRFWGFISLCWNPGLCGLSHFSVVPHGLSTGKCGTPCSTSRCESSPPWLPISAPPTSLDECFFFNSLVIRLPYSSIFWKFWLFFVFKFVVLLLVVEETKYLS